jgi:hypothetical protein
MSEKPYHATVPLSPSSQFILFPGRERAVAWSFGWHVGLFSVIAMTGQ